MIQKSPGVSPRRLGQRNDHQTRLNMCHQVVCSEVGSRWWCRHHLVYPSKGNEEGSLECLENYGQCLVRTFLPSSMRPTPQLVQGSGTSRISRGSLLERKIRSFKSEQIKLGIDRSQVERILIINQTIGDPIKRAKLSVTQAKAQAPLAKCLR